MFQGPELEELSARCSAKQKNCSRCEYANIFTHARERCNPPYERKIPTAIDSRGSIRSGSSVGFGRSVSNRHEQQRVAVLPMGEGAIRKKHMGRREK